jgi:hypothetical protein
MVLWWDFAGDWRSEAGREDEQAEGRERMIKNT